MHLCNYPSIVNFIYKNERDMSRDFHWFSRLRFAKSNLRNYRFFFFALHDYLHISLIFASIDEPSFTQYVVVNNSLCRKKGGIVRLARPNLQLRKRSIFHHRISLSSAVFVHCKKFLVSSQINLWYVSTFQTMFEF